MNIQQPIAVLRLAAAASLALCAIAPASAAEAPQFTHTQASEWINSQPLTLADFSGRVLLVDVWTFDCWNCYRSIPWLKDLETRLGPKGLALLGVHSPEFAHEKERDRVVAKVKEFGIRHPVMLDNDFSYWNALGNRYWPAFYVIDKQGRLRGSFVGETHVGDRRAREVEELVTRLLVE
ncbi:MAG TPA: redoxin family protein [Steroidobacteraceae bacterium]|nr:redoxin family protein [Steroidobacteraceae bacterium]